MEKSTEKNQGKSQDDFFLPIRGYIELPLPKKLEVLTTLKRKKKKKLN